MPGWIEPAAREGVRTGPEPGREPWRARRRARIEALRTEHDREFRGRIDAARIVINGAGDLLARGWVQNVWYAVADDQGRTRPVSAHNLDEIDRGTVAGACLVGALVHAAGGREAARAQVTGDALDLIWHTAFRDRTRYPVDFSPPPSIRTLRVLDLTRWNDHPLRAHAQVLTLIDAADSRAILEATADRR